MCTVLLFPTYVSESLKAYCLLTYVDLFIEISSKHDKSSCQCCFSLLFKATDHCKLNKKKIQLRSLLPPIRATEIVECVRKYVDGISCICKYAYVYVHNLQSLSPYLPCPPTSCLVLLIMVKQVKSSSQLSRYQWVNQYYFPIIHHILIFSANVRKVCYSNGYDLV